MTSRPAVGILALVLSGGVSSFLLGDDCNQNGIEDPEDIRSGTSPDCNRNSLPDECDVDEVVTGFSSFPTIVSEGSFGLPLVSDLDGDGRPDIAALDRTGTGALLIIRNRADGVWEALAPLSVPGASTESGAALVAADFDGDGRVDLAMPARTLGSVEVLLQEAPWVFGARISFKADRNAPIWLAAGDLDGDLDPDLVVKTMSRLLRILFNAGGGVF
ncbi:MAG TPA: FG-GAP-like repeat-containing protein, partial [Planctomycetota bacterium]|nr:FG-GAP-like repeat-containing protein [Planctomycetota bacterium]